LEKEIFFIAVNQEIVDKNIKLKDSDEVALLPPISGG
jgi:molybdopterin converting factor small subunit